MAGKLSANAIESGSITFSKLDSNLSSKAGILKVSSIVYESNIFLSKGVSINGNETVQIIGSGFNSNANVYIDFELATNINVANSNSLTFSTPAKNVGTYTLQVQNPDGASVTVMPGLEYGELHSFQGTTFGYVSGGKTWPQTPPFPVTTRNEIIRFAFASSITSYDIGDLTVARTGAVGQSSKVNGYTSGATNVIDKFPFASIANATDVGDLTFARGGAGQSSAVSGYTSGSSPTTNVIDKFPFASDANATDVGDLTVGRGATAGQSSTENGYTSGGVSPPTSVLNIIDKFPFATDTNATDVGNLTQSRRRSSGQSSADSGYTSSGSSTAPFPPTRSNVIDKFPFASDANATDVGDVGTLTEDGAGSSSTSHGYHMGGLAPYPISPFFTVTSTVQRFSFASDGNAASVGSLIAGRYGHAGQQY